MQVQAPLGSTPTDIQGDLSGCDFNPPQIIGDHGNFVQRQTLPVTTDATGQPGCVLNEDTIEACAPFVATNVAIPDSILTDKGAINYSPNTPQSYRVNQLIQMGVHWFAVPGGPQQVFNVATQAPHPAIVPLPVIIRPPTWSTPGGGSGIVQGPVAAIGTDLQNALPVLSCDRMLIIGQDPKTDQPIYAAPGVATAITPAVSRDGGPVSISGCSGLDGSVPKSITATGTVLPGTGNNAPIDGATKIAGAAAKPTSFFAVAVLVVILFIIFAFSGKVIGDL